MMTGNLCEGICSRCYRLNLSCTGPLNLRAHKNSGRALAIGSRKKDAYLLHDQPPRLDSPYDTRSSLRIVNPFEMTKYHWVKLDPRIKYMALVVIANTASKTILSVAHSKGGLSSVDTLEEIYRCVSQMIGSHECRTVLIEWGDAMGKPKGTKYGKKPDWWPKSVEFKDPKKLSSQGKLFYTDANGANISSGVKKALDFAFCGSHGSLVPLWELHDALKHTNLKKRDRELLTWIIFTKKVSIIEKYQACGKFESK